MTQLFTPEHGMLEKLSFRWEWRKYQRMVLDVFENRRSDKRTFHIVAPPGSGKTLLGLEIIRRVGKPAVTFSPTTTIQEQWRDKVRFFLPEDGPEEEVDAVMALCSTDPRKLGVISSLTYQSLGTQTDQRDFLDTLGRQAWVDELIYAGRTEESANAYLDDIGGKSPEVLRRGIANRARARKRELLASGEVEIEQILHPNALQLIESIVTNGTGCIILDESHHLLDYWALILAELIRRLPDALVVGLTATPPASAEPGEIENYLALVNGIDFEVPTPAVVRNGDLSAYQDLVLLTAPTDVERAFLGKQDETLHDSLQQVLDDPRFLPRLNERINRPAKETTWTKLLEEEFGFAVAGVRYLVEKGAELNRDIEVFPELRKPTTLDDRVELVREWTQGVLRLSPDENDARMLGDVRAALRTLGILLTETGWRRGPSPVDRVLAYSKGKVEGVVEILRTESESMGDHLRAAVLTDYERSSSIATRQLKGVLDAESGGAVQVIRALAADNITNRLDPVMLTGRTVIVDADWADVFLEESQRWFASRDLRVDLTMREVPPSLMLIEGTGADWRPRYYVAFITELFERGLTKCLVGTRGLLAEGWDSLSLNTLIDLTTAGTFASVNQIRGRSIRLDPNFPRKVANNWDVVCYAPDLEGGDRDLHRVIQKHAHTWGLARSGRIVKGVGHVNEDLLFLRGSEQGHIHRHLINRDALVRARKRDEAYDRWGIGKPYDNFIFRGTVLNTGKEPLRTAFTFKRSLRAMLNIAAMTFFYYLLLSGFNGLEIILELVEAAEGGAALALTMAVIVAPAAAAAPLFWRYFREAFIELPVDSYLEDFGRAVAQSLRDSGLAPAHPDQVSVAVTEEMTYSVQLNSKDGEAVTLFARAYRELFDPIVDQRYLVSREEASLSLSFYAPIWYLIRSFFRILRRSEGRFYHPVPSLFARRKELAETFGQAWARWVGGGELIYTRNPKGSQILLRERAARKMRMETTAIEEWR